MITGKARLAAVLGWPISHSKSPLLHNYWLQEYGIDGAYVPCAVEPENLSEAISGLQALGFRGCNVTIPHKEAVASLCDEVTDAARDIGAVNTVTFTEGAIVGDNTDGYGFLQNLTDGSANVGGGWNPADGPALVLGAGGAARAIVYALAMAGVPKITIANRSLDRASRLSSDMAAATGRDIVFTDFDKVAEHLGQAHLLVNTTSLGMQGQPPLDLPLDMLSPDALVTDIVYTPLKTPLLALADARGNRTVDGLGMLLYQAVPGFEIWFGQRPAVTDALRNHVLAGR